MILALTIGGLFLNLAGILILFRWGIAFQVKTDGAIHIIAEQRDDVGAAKERTLVLLTWVGFILTVSGTVAQGAAAIIDQLGLG